MQSRLDPFAFQIRLAVHVTTRDGARRLAAAMMIMVICWTFGDPNVAITWSAVIVLMELALRVVNRRITLEGPEFSVFVGCLIWIANWIMLTPLLIPAVILAGLGSKALLMIGMLWAFGIMVHISHTYAAMPFPHLTLMTSSTAAVVMVFWTAATVPEVASTQAEWLAALTLFAVFIVGMFESTTLQKRVMSQLNDARRDANKRLSDLEFLTQHDHLTGLMNRRAFEEAATKLLPRNRKTDKGQFGYYLLDLDGFKPINDSYSHKAGDAVLVGVADRLERYIGERGLVARLGGDEFAIAIPNLTSAEEAKRIGKEIAALVCAPLVVDHKNLSVGTSIGIAMSTTQRDSLAALASGADQAMFLAKNDPGKVVAVYDKASFPARASLDDRAMILRAMQKKQIAPYYQPKVALDTGKIVGFEALSRWRHPARGLLLPGKFLPFINELGLQGDFLMHTTKMVLQQVTQMLDEGLDPGEVSVNVPEVTLATVSGRAAVMELINRYPRARAKLTFEVTEDVFIARSGAMIQDSITHFRKAGVRISLDDFGTGFASFKHLRELEFDELKLDTAFVRGLGQEKEADVLVKGFLGIGHGLGVKVIAEGVETRNQRDLLRQMGCEFGQGFYFGKAKTFSETRLILMAEATGRKAAAAKSDTPVKRAAS